MHIDLGCGHHKHSNFFGIDREALPGVDLVCDINAGIPLPDNAVEFVMASRSLPFVTDLFTVMSELYRICRHKAIVCILAPYAHHFRHTSNPYLKQKFDEYTPRYLTNSFLQPAGSPICPPVPEYREHHSPFDFRLIRMELFYEPPYSTTLYEQDELDMLQYVQPNLISEIMYHFVVVKQELRTDDWHRICNQKYAEPIWTPSLRRQRAPEIEESFENLDAIPQSKKASPVNPTSSNESIKSPKKSTQPVKKKTGTHK
ncbi:hypothetical protein [Paenibacillus qinlingensis]|uniref:Methyltransferase type 11 domain-containing protein n=1 Tax=Paenibacillus qinlingensis TaxID=1837343 RepID=A0ABU1P1Y7_9BACL|nr:hypothetical protein [Paenibacillus qinlingensis]MDR6553247.1 hypothetical protein [Paenibacillus qinlingensis]